jgi:hypothetical protein
MDLPDHILQRFRRLGQIGGRRRAAALSSQRRTAIARRAAATRWIRQRFGSATFQELGLPGSEIIDAGLADLADGRETAESLAVSLAAPRLRREGLPIGAVQTDPERRLYQALSRENGELAHARYNAYLRRVVSFADACRLVRIDRGSRAR